MRHGDIPGLSAGYGKDRNTGKQEPGMNIEIRNRELEARIQRQIRATGSE